MVERKIKSNKSLGLKEGLERDMRGKSLPSELTLEIIFFFFLRFLKEVGKGDNFFFLSKYYIIFFHAYFNKREKLGLISLFVSITLKFAVFTHQCAYVQSFTINHKMFLFWELFKKTYF